MKPKLRMQQEIMSLDICCVNYVPPPTATSKGCVLCVFFGLLSKDVDALDAKATGPSKCTVDPES